MDLLGDMPIGDYSFALCYIFYKEKGREKEYREALCKYIELTNRPIRKSIEDYCIRRQGEWDRDEKIAKELLFRRREKKEEERLRKWNG